MRIFTIIILTVMVAMPTFGQQKYFKIQKENSNSTKKVKLRSDIETVEFKLLKDSSETYVYTSGYLKKISNDSITLKTRYIESVKYYEGSSVGTYSSYSWGKHKLTKLALDDISGLEYWNPGRRATHHISISALVIGLFTGLIVAPLVSYDFKEKYMNIDRYKTIVLSSSIVVGVSIPIIVLTKKKKVSISEKGLFDWPEWKLAED